MSVYILTACYRLEPDNLEDTDIAADKQAASWWRCTDKRIEDTESHIEKGRDNCIVEGMDIVEVEGKLQGILQCKEAEEEPLRRWLRELGWAEEGGTQAGGYHGKKEGRRAGFLIAR